MASVASGDGHDGRGQTADRVGAPAAQCPGASRSLRRGADALPQAPPGLSPQAPTGQAPP